MNNRKIQKMIKKITAITLAFMMLPFAECSGVIKITTAQASEEAESGQALESKEIPLDMILEAAIVERGRTQLKFNTHEGAFLYKIYRNNELIGTIENNTGSYSDNYLEGNLEYTYRVERCNENGEIISKSNDVVLETPESLVINEEITIDEDMELFSLSLEGGHITFENCTITVMQNININMGENAGVTLKNAKIICNGNINIEEGSIYNYDYENYLYVGGDIVCDGNRNQLDIKNIELCGDLIFGYYSTPVISGKLILSGKNRQNIMFTDERSNYHNSIDINEIEVNNTSEEGVYCCENITYQKLVTNNNKIYIGDEPAGEESQGNYGLTLDKDTTIEGDYILSGGELNLNGHTLAIEGDFIHSAGNVNVNGGKLIVKKNYRQQSRRGEVGKYTYSSSCGKIIMENPDDYICVYGDYICNSRLYEDLEYGSRMTEGVLEVKGNIEIKNIKNGKAFYAAYNHTLVLSGEKKQTVIINNEGETEPCFSNLEIRNTGSEGVEFVGEPLFTGEVNDNNTDSNNTAGSIIKGYIRANNSTSFKNGSYKGNVKFFDYEGSFINDDTTILGSVITDELYLNGKLMVAGDLISESSVYIEGGTLCIAGNIKTAKGLFASSDNTLILNGESAQKVEAKEDIVLGRVELENTSSEGITFSSVFYSEELVKNNTKIAYEGIEGSYGWILSKDETIEGDLVLVGDTLDLNGHRLTVTGDFIHYGGEVNVNGGELIAEGNYIGRTKKRVGNEYEYVSSAGYIKMTNPADYVCIKGDYISRTVANVSEGMSEGILEIKGNLDVNKFEGANNHTIIFSGDKKQDVLFTGYNSIKISNFENRNTTKEGLEMIAVPAVTGKAVTNGNIVKGYISVTGTTEFDNDCYDGNICYAEEQDIKDITVNGSIKIEEKVNIYGNVTVLNDVIINKNGISMKGSSLTVKGDLKIDSGYENYITGIDMRYTNDYLLIEGDLKNAAGYIKKGIIEVKGDIELKTLFGYSESKIILSGDKRQDIRIDEEGNYNTSVRLGILELNNTSEEGVYADKVFKTTKLIKNDTAFHYGDMEGVSGHKLNENEVIEGDFVLFSDTLDLNGYTMTIKGDFFNCGGKIYVNGGKLIVEGNYMAQLRSGEEGSCEYSSSLGSLVMNKESDYVTVYGDYISDSYAESTMTNGTLEVKGNMSVKGGEKSFYAGNNHTLLLSGDKKQTIDIESYSNQIRNFTVENISTEGIDIKVTPVVTGMITTVGSNRIEGYLSVNGAEFSGNYYSGSVSVVGITNVSDLTVNGDFSINYDIEMNEGTTLKVLGDFINNRNVTLTKGIIEAGGNFEDNGKLIILENSKVVLNGNSLQKAKVNESTYFENLELKNESVEGVVFNRYPMVRYYTVNDTGLSYENEEESEFYGFKLDSNYLVEGDFKLKGGALDLNGYKLTVTGNFIHEAGDVIINGGELNIGGDYRIQSLKKNYCCESMGRLFMSGEYDKIIVNGDIHIETYNDISKTITSGNIKLSGNLIINNGSGLNIGAGIEFCGDEKQTVSSAQLFSVKNFTNNNTKGLELNSDIHISGKLSDKTQTVTGSRSVSIDYPNNIEGGKWSSNLKIEKKGSTGQKLEIGGKLIISRDIYLSDDIHAASIELNGKMTLAGSCVICSGDFDILSYGSISMTNANDSIKVGGNFINNSDPASISVLTKGKIEVAGEFRIFSDAEFIAKDEHKVILSKKDISYSNTQNVSLGNTVNKFNTLILRNAEEYYNFEDIDDIRSRANEVIINEYDNEKPSDITRIKAETVRETYAEITYSGARDNIKIAGYEIYRNGKKIAETYDTVYKDTGLMPDTEYTYKVYAYDEDMNVSEDSVELKIHTPADNIPPDEVKNLEAITRTGSSITLSWDEPYDNSIVKGYMLYRNGNLIANLTGKTTYKDTGLFEGKDYKYTIIAYDISENYSKESEELSMSVAMPLITGVSPSHYSTLKENEVNLVVKFRDVLNSEGNRVNIEYLNEKGEWEMLPKTYLSQEKYDSTTLYASYRWDISDKTGDKEYNIRCTLYDSDGNTDVEEIIYRIDKEAPKLPQNIKVQSDNGNMTVSYKASESADCMYYNIYRRMAGEDEGVLIKSIEGRYETFYTDRDVEEGKEYFYSISVSDSSGNISGMSEEVSGIVQKDEEAPVVRKITPEAGRISKNTLLIIEAEDNKNVSKVELLYRSEEEEEWRELSSIEYSKIGKYTWNTENLEDGAYFICAYAIDEAGNKSTEEFTRRYEVDNTGISRINITKHTEGASYIQLHWKDVTDSDFSYFQVEMLKDGKYIEVGKEKVNLGYIVSDLESDTEYTFRVVGYDDLGNRGIESEEYTAKTTADNISPEIVSILPVQSRYNETLKLEVKARDNYALHYVVFSYSTDKENYTEIAKVNAKADKKEDTFAYEFDTSELPEGEIYIKFEVYDKAGNKNVLLKNDKEVTATYIIDRTAPGKVEAVTIMESQGNVSLHWKEGVKDIASYNIYRKDKTNGEYKLLRKGFESLNYYDTEVEDGDVYRYKVSAVDIAGNEGEQSEEVIITVRPDEEKPKIISMLPAEGKAISKNPAFKIWIYDNCRLKEAVIRYKGINDSNNMWNIIDTVTLSGNEEKVEKTWDTTGLSEGEYVISVIAYDMSGNVSEQYEAVYNLDLTAPRVRAIDAKDGDYKTHIEITGEKEEDFSHYEIYRKKEGTDEYKRIKSLTDETTYTDTGVEVLTNYKYKVRAYDMCGNYSESEEDNAYVTDNDTIKPTAIIPENITGMTGLEIALDGSKSYDNHKIKKYKWNMGNGDIVTGRQAVYTYDREGVYTVILEVTDEAGNTAKTSASIHVYDSKGNGMSQIKVTDIAGRAIPYAMVYAKSDNDEILNLKADANGMVRLAGKTGVYTIAAMKGGYLPAEMEVALSEYETKEYTLRLKEGEIVVGEMKVHKMTMQEMIEAGVDINNPENLETVIFTVELGFSEQPIKEKVEYINSGTETKIKVPETNESTTVGTIMPSGSTTIDIIEPAEGEKPIHVYLRTTQNISWLKDMYSVSLGIINQADTKFVLKDSIATLNLPRGLSLAVTESGQSLVHEFGDIKGQESVNASWIVKGDKSGDYKLSAEFSGRLMPFNEQITKKFVAEERFEVTDGTGLKVIIRPEEEAYDGELYYVQFRIVNESDKTFYNFTTSIGDSEIPYEEEIITVKDLDGTEEVLHAASAQNYVVSGESDNSVMPMLKDGDVLTIPVLKPGDEYHGTWKTMFAGRKKEEGEGEDTYYELVHEAVKVWNDDSKGVIFTFEPIKSHIKKSKIRYEKAPDMFGDPVDTATGAFTDDIEAFSITGATKISLDMSYNSLDSEIRGEAGYGWNHNYESHLKDKKGMIEFYNTNNSAISFIKEEILLNNVYGISADGKIILDIKEEDTNGKYVCLSEGMKDYTLTKNENGYVVNVEGGDTYTYNTDGKLIGIKDADGKAVSITRGKKQAVVKEELSGKELVINYNDGGMITSVRDENRMISMSYDENGNLVSFTDENGDKRTFEYDNNHRIIKEKNALDITFVENEYDKTGRVTKQTDAENGVILFEYSENGDETTTTKITDANGVEKSLEANEKGLVTKVTDADESITRYSYDDKGRIKSETDANSNITYNQYDEEGNLICVTDSLGNKTYTKYDEKGNVIKVISGKAKKEGKISAEYKYDKNNRLIYSKEEGGKETVYEYNEYGQVIKKAIRGIGETTYTYENGMLKETTDYNKNVTKYAYDEAGNIKTRTDADGTKTTYEYDKKRQLISETDALGNTTRYEYDCNGNLTAETDALGYKAEYEYDGNGRKIIEKYEDGSSVIYEYDANGNKTAQVDSDRTTKYEYDTKGNLIKETMPDGTYIEYTYNILNQRKSEAKNGEEAIKYGYYPNGKLYKTTYPTGESITNTYDESWRLIRQTQQETVPHTNTTAQEI